MSKIIFFGTSEFAADILEAVASNFKVVAVVTQPDKPVGRKQEISASPVAKLAATKSIPVLKPESLRSEDIKAQLQNFSPDLFVVIAYGKIIPQNILDIPKNGAINIHPSLLPKYRGTSPIQAALLNGDSETGVTIMLMDAEMDHGPILMQEAVAIGPEETFVDLNRKLCELSQKMIVEAIPAYLDGNLPAEAQDHSKATLVKIISKEDGRIDWNNSAREIYNKYRAYLAWPGVWTTFNGQMVKLRNLKMRPEEKTNSSERPGMVSEHANKVYVGTKDGQIELIELQLEGKNPVKAQDFVRGHKDFIGSKLV